MTKRQSEARVANSFTSSRKDSMRQHNLDVVRSAVGLLDNYGQLRCDWAELAGASALCTVQLLESAKVLRPGGYIGIDQDPKLIASLKASRPDLRWLAGDLRHHVSWLCTEAEVGVLCFDGYLEIGTRQAGAIFTTFRPIIQRAIRLFGTCVLLSNNDLSSVVRHPFNVHEGRPEIAVRRHTEIVLELLEGYAERRKLPSLEELLPNDFTDKILDASYNGPVGPYRIYKGGTGPFGHRMIQLGLVL